MPTDAEADPEQAAALAVRLPLRLELLDQLGARAPLFHRGTVCQTVVKPLRAFSSLACMTDDAIVVEGLEKSYGSVRALNGIDFAARTGSVLGLLGPNGAGKTTAVRILTTLLEADAGTARVAGLDVKRDAAELRAKIGLAGQYAAVDENLTGFENLEMVGRLYHLGKAASRQRADELLERFELTDAAKRPAKTYSGGMRRRLDLAAALVARPPVLFLDEPTTGLDPRSRIGMWETIEVAGGGGRHGAAHHPVPRRGRPARRPDRGDRPRPRDRRGHRGRAQGADRRRAARHQARGPRRRRRRDRSAGRDVPGPCDGGGTASSTRRCARATASSPRPCASSTQPASRSTTSRSTGPTLDDVFIALTGHAAEDTTGAPEEEKEAAAA